MAETERYYNDIINEKVCCLLPMSNGDVFCCLSVKNKTRGNLSNKIYRTSWTSIKVIDSKSVSLIKTIWELVGFEGYAYDCTYLPQLGRQNRVLRNSLGPTSLVSWINIDTSEEPFMTTVFMLINQGSVLRLVCLNILVDIRKVTWIKT